MEKIMKLYEKVPRNLIGEAVADFVLHGKMDSEPIIRDFVESLRILDTSVEFSLSWYDKYFNEMLNKMGFISKMSSSDGSNFLQMGFADGNILVSAAFSYDWTKRKISHGISLHIFHKTVQKFMNGNVEDLMIKASTALKVYRDLEIEKNTDFLNKNLFSICIRAARRAYYDTNNLPDVYVEFAKEGLVEKEDIIKLLDKETIHRHRGTLGAMKYKI
jgi:hypothetical protein